MDFQDPVTQYAAGGTALALLVAFVMYQPSNMVKWLQKKNYQYEVTSSLYMLTPTEKFVFNSVLFLTLSLLTMACIVYLPDHVTTMSRRTYYYFAGDAWTREIAGTAKSAIGVVKSATTGLAKSAVQSASSTAAAAGEAVSEAVVEGGKAL